MSHTAVVTRAAAFLLATLTACGSSGSSGSTAPPEEPDPPPPAAEEIAAGSEAPGEEGDGTEPLLAAVQLEESQGSEDGDAEGEREAHAALQLEEARGGDVDALLSAGLGGAGQAAGPPGRRRSSRGGPGSSSGGAGAGDDALAGLVDSSAAPRPGPRRPSRDDVVSALVPLRPDVARCGRREARPIRVRVTFAPDGAVQDASIPQTISVDDTERACVIEVVRGARVPAFEGAPLRTVFPFRLADPAREDD